MASVNLDDIVRVTAKMNYGGGDIQNVFHVKYNGTPQDDVDFMDDVSDAVDTYYSGVVAQISSYVNFGTIGFYNITQDRPMGEQAWPTLTVGGNSTGEHLAAQLAPLVLFGTYTPRSQGRKYLPFLTTNNTGNYASLDSVVLTAIATWAANFLGTTALTVGSVTFGNWNKTLTRWAPWVNAFVQAYCRTQKRRFRDVGS
jgi:hypothetical protein